jgi:hypothetical protein
VASVPDDDGEDDGLSAEALRRWAEESSLEQALDAARSLPPDERQLRFDAATHVLRGRRLPSESNRAVFPQLEREAGLILAQLRRGEVAPSKALDRLMLRFADALPKVDMLAVDRFVPTDDDVAFLERPRLGALAVVAHFVRRIGLLGYSPAEATTVEVEGKIKDAAKKARRPLR